MTTTTSADVITEWVAMVESGEALSTALDIPPCETLHMLFPAIVGDDNAMGALAALLDPVIRVMAEGVEHGLITPDGAERFTHDVYHLLQIGAGLGHMLGVNDALGMASDLPASLEDVAWDDLPVVFADDDDATTATAAHDQTPTESEGSESEDS